MPPKKEISSSSITGKNPDAGIDIKVTTSSKPKLLGFDLNEAHSSSVVF